jgi:hypothetical protein
MRALARLHTGDLAGARADRDRIARIPLPLATAAVAALDGAITGDVDHWRRADERLSALGIALHATAARWRAALATSDSATAAAIEHALSDRVAAPVLFLAMLAPALS